MAENPKEIEEARPSLSPAEEEEASALILALEIAFQKVLENKQDCILIKDAKETTLSSIPAEEGIHPVEEGKTESLKENTKDNHMEQAALPADQPSLDFVADIQPLPFPPTQRPVAEQQPGACAVVQPGHVADHRPAVETLTQEAQVDLVQAREQDEEDPITTTSSQELVTAELVDEPVEAVPVPFPDPETMQTEDHSTLEEDKDDAGNGKRRLYLCISALLMIVLASILAGAFLS